MNEYSFFVLLFGMVVGARKVYQGARQLHSYLKSPARHERLAARRRLSSGVDALHEGERVTLTGTVRVLDELVEERLSGREGVIAVAECNVVLPLAGGRRFDVVDSIHDFAMRPFVLETSHGTIIVDGREATIDLPASPVIPRRLEREQALLLGHHYDIGKVEGRGFRELVVGPGDRVSVAGVIRLVRDESIEHGYRDAPTKARLVADEKFPMAIGKPR